MNRILLTCMGLLLATLVVNAQNVITGRVTELNDNSGLPGVSVSLKGTSKGTITDSNGSFRIEVDNQSSILVFSFVGYQTVEEIVGGRSEIQVSLTMDVTQLSEVVVTALGIERDKASLGYAVQEVDGENLIKTGEQNFLGALSGKVAGVQIVNPSGASIGGSVNVRIRGSNSVYGNNRPLYVVDGVPISNDNPNTNTYNGRDYGNLAQDINPEDIETISILKGPAASAMYGMRGKNGVVLIKTKSGKGIKKGLGIEYSGQVNLDRVYVLPEFQNEFAGGYSPDFDEVNGEKTLQWYADESWGPKIDGTPIRHWYSWFPGTPEYGRLDPLVANPDNVKDFYNTGVTQVHNLSISGNSEKSNFRFSYGRTDIEGAVPSSKGNKNNSNLNFQSHLSEKLTLSTNVNLSNNYFKGRPGFGYTGSFDSWTLINVGPALNMWTQRQLDYRQLRNFRLPDGSIKTWNIRDVNNPVPAYWDNIYFMLENAYPEDSRDRVIGSVALDYKITSALSIKGTAKTDFHLQKLSQRIPTEALAQEFYYETSQKSLENNYELMINYNENFEDFSIAAYLGGNIFKTSFNEVNTATNGGFTVPNWFNVEASVDRPDTENYSSERSIRSVFGAANLGYKNMLYLDLALRKDWTSSLPKGNNGYAYPSVGLGFVFSELTPSLPFLSFGKIRGTYAQVGNDLSPYVINQTYRANAVYNGSASFYIPDALVDPQIKPSLSTSVELGLELKMLHDRIGLDFNYYEQNSKDEIINLNISGASGYSGYRTNGGEILSKGIEITATGTPVKTPNFTWDVALNFSQNKSTVEKLIGDLTSYEVLARRGVSVNAVVGEEWGVLKGRDIRRDENGNSMVQYGPSTYHSVDANSGTQSLYYLRDDNKVIGKVLPDFIGGITNTFTYKSFDLSLNIDFQKGGNFHSVTRLYGFYAGQLKETAAQNDNGMSVRDPVSQGGGFLVEGVLGDGTEVSGHTSGSDFGHHLAGIPSQWIYDASYVKLREVRLNYNVPSGLIARTPFKKIGFALSVRNAWLIHSNIPGIDPSEVTPDASGVAFHEGGGLPSFRTYGFNLRLGI